MKLIKKIIGEMFGEELAIQHKLLNLILSAAFCGGLISLTASIIIQLDAIALLAIALLIAVVGLSLWIANVKKRPQTGALLIVSVGNMVLFPLMYFTGGGLYSGMPVWVLLGLIFSWLILSGRWCVIMYIVNILAAATCMLVEMWYPESVIPLEGRNAAYIDMIQSMVIVTCIFGGIFKYQTYVYEKQRKQILKANAAKSEFLANMSHELRTPINAILGYNEILMRETRESQTVGYASNVRLAGRNLLSLVSTILDFTDMEKANLQLAEAPYYLREVLQDALTFAEYGAESKGLELRIQIDEQLPQELVGDVARIKQILDNLISNAIKYTLEGYIEISAAWESVDAESGKLRIAVKDSGIGMKPEDVQKISESFIRFDKEITGNIQGIGLGLTIVTRLLHVMNSGLEVESMPGAGSCFSFCLGQKVVDATPIGKLETRENFQLLENAEESWTAPLAKVLLVEDNPMNLDVLTGMLRMTGLQIDTAGNGVEALEKMRENQYHIILMDHMMPIMDGVEALHRMREEGLCEGVPALVLTANAVGDARERYLQEGFDEYLSKPIVYGQLMAKLRQFLPEELLQTRGKEENEAVDLWSVLEKETGLTYCCGSEEFYREMLGSYLGNNRLQQIETCFAEENWEDYRIGVHALKSTSLSIGATVLSEAAKQLEFAAKEGRIDDIRANHAATMEQYEKLLELIRQELCDTSVPEEKALERKEEKAKILVVDDDNLNLMFAQKLLGEEYTTDCVKSGKEALEYLKTELPNLILLDLHMPKMSGFEVLERITKEERLKEIPVVFLTADNDREAEIEGFRRGAQDFIKKPFVADIMLERINRILELDRLRKNLSEEVQKQTLQAELRRQKVERLSLQIMVTLANTIDAKDKYTNGHSLRVAEYAREIARRAGKSVQEQEDIYYVGLLHDIGKIGIPNSIIRKTSGLTEEEYQTIKGHAEIGAEILDNMTEIPGLAVGAHWHHEHFDGSGYPQGLKAEEIPETARIIGVADAYDAMASKRSYRDVLPQEVVKSEIEKGSGSQFDPEFVKIMLAMIAEDKDYQMREQ